MSLVLIGATYTINQEETMDKLLDQVEHLWTDHKKLVIGVVVVIIILAIA
mgnify:CR=1